MKSIEKSNIIVEQACGICLGTARFPSGQRGWTVNPSAMPPLVRIQLSPPLFAEALSETAKSIWERLKKRLKCAGIAQLAERQPSKL